MKNKTIWTAVKKYSGKAYRPIINCNINTGIMMFLRSALTFFILVSSFLVLTRALEFFDATPSPATPKKTYFDAIKKQNNLTEEDFKKYFIDPSGKNASNNNDHEDNSLEILSIPSIFGGVLAYIFKVVVQRNLEDENRHYTEAQMLKVGGTSAYHRFLIYRDACPGRKTPQDTLAILHKARKDTEKGLRLANSLDGSSNRNELLVCVLKNNIAWYYKEELQYVKNNFTGVELDILKNKYKSKRDYVFCLINYVIKRAESHPDHDNNWRHTHNEIRKTF